MLHCESTLGPPLPCIGGNKSCASMSEVGMTLVSDGLKNVLLTHAEDLPQHNSV